MSTPISLTDSELEAIMTAAKPLAPWQRDRFLRRIAEEIVALGEQRGDGSVARAIRSVWREHYDPPDLRADESRSRAY